MADTLDDMEDLAHQVYTNLLRDGHLQFLTQGGDGRDVLLIIRRSIQAAREPQPPALELLRKFVSGEGGRRTGDFIRRGWIKVEVTELGQAALHAWAEKGHE